MEKYPDIEWVYATASEPGKQTSDIEDMMTQGVTGLVLPTSPPRSRRSHKRRKIVESFLSAWIAAVTSPIADVFLEGDNKAFGRKSAEYIVDRMKGKGKIVILRGRPSTVDSDRYDAAMAVFG